MTANDPFARLPEAASFSVASTTVTDGAALPPEQLSSGVPGGKDVSPQLSWHGAPDSAPSWSWRRTAWSPCAPASPSV